MFGFDRPEDGSEERFKRRRLRWRVFGVQMDRYLGPAEMPRRHTTRLRHYVWWIIHNCVAHFLIGVCPLRAFFKFHDWTSHKMTAPKEVG